MIHSPKARGLRTSVSLLALASAWFAVQPALAQDQSVETVTVSGYRQSLLTSEALKRDSVNLVEAISAMDIGKLPDSSIADSLARLPGLAAQRVDGRSQVIAIRGLSPDFAGTTFNGRDQVSTGDNRGVEFDQYPAEILSGVVVYKTSDPVIVGAGLSGTVDLKSARPLDYSGRQLAFGARGEYSSLGNLTHEVSPFGQRYNLTYIDQFLDKKLGIAFGFAHLDSPFQEKHYKAWWWANTDLWGTPQAGKPADADALEGAELWVRSKDQVRDSFVTTLEFQPNEVWHSTLDVYYSNFNQKEYMHGGMWTADPFTSYSFGGVTSPAIGMSNAATSQYLGNKLVTSGTWQNLRPVVRNDYNTRVDVLHSIGWRNEFNFGKFTTTADVSYSDAKRGETHTELYAGRTAVSSMDFVVPTRPMFPSLKPSVSFADPASVVLFDAQKWGHDGRIDKPTQKDVIEAVRLDGKYQFDGFIDSVELGANYQTRQKSRSYLVYFATQKSPLSQVSSDLLYSPTDLSFGGFGPILTFNTPGVLNKYYNTALNMSDGDWRKDFKVKEKVFTSFAKINYKTSLYGVDLKGSVGGQLIHTDQESSAFNVSGVVQGGPAPTVATKAGKSYWDFLPSINVNADFGDGSILRLVVAKTMARPRMDQLRAAASASVDLTKLQWNGDGGNPRLSPWRADAIDLSFEHYISEGSYFAIAGFYKNLTSYVYNQNISNFNFTGYIDPNGNTDKATSVLGNYSTPANGRGGYVRGVEVSTQLDGNLLSSALDGFGLSSSFSWTDTSIKPDGPGTALNATLPGLSKAVADLTVYYEKDGFSIRVAEKYRSDFRGEISGLFADRVYTRILAEAQTDLQLGYDFQSGSLDGMSIQFQVNNLFNSPYRTVQDPSTGAPSRFPLEYDLYGRQILLGVNYKL
ncbi:iron complex outermembrane receptor protein [Rhizomicrobium palustre]|uniref:Iron complex outermembrane receptor protein n=1 Tax=Rhizomicrobium palustre TaxID=189966 RepID=A0A846N008_9PROT|nr:TonB-dependent receptor [Rhizomicrobium palustre]NIK88893.1 iron complex outermembrane receptor protein [Rhizomicrobium palustre]